MKILITGTAGFIGAALADRLLQNNIKIAGIDNLNDYYDIQLKKDRVNRFIDNKNYSNFNIDISDKKLLEEIFIKFQPDIVINLAAQAGVRYSLENPMAYIQSNIVGFTNILEACRDYGVKHLIYASSSSVYGNSKAIPFIEDGDTSQPLSLYAASKKSNELMAYSYSHLFGFRTTGLRFFTVYGPWGRPDMALFKFTKSIVEGRPLQIYNHGHHFRDFTYIDDVIDAIYKIVLAFEDVGESSSQASIPRGEANLSNIFNIGSSSPIALMDYISAIENSLGIKAIKEFLPLQPGDMDANYANTSKLNNLISYSPSTNLAYGVKEFVSWYLDYYKVTIPTK